MKLDLYKASIFEIAHAVRVGQIDISEVPISRRDAVKFEIAEFKTPVDIIDIMDKHSDLQSMSKRKLLAEAKKHPSIVYESRMTKSELIKSITEARESDEN